MAISAQASANAVLHLAQDANSKLTNMQLQKLVFLGQGYCLALVDRPLYYNNTHAWQWGPVVPKLYKVLQQYGSGWVTQDVPADDQLAPETEEYRILNGVWKGYGHLTGLQLSEITHRAGSPWANTWATNKFGVIPPEEIQNYYRGLLAPRK